MLIVTLNRHSENNKGPSVSHFATRYLRTLVSHLHVLHWSFCVLVEVEEGGEDVTVAPCPLALGLIPACQSLLQSNDTQETSVWCCPSLPQ